MDSLDIEYLERKKLRLLFSFNFFLLVLDNLLSCSLIALRQRKRVSTHTREPENGSLFIFNNFFLLVLTKLYIMQEPIDNHPSEILTREEELSMADTKDLVKHILYIEAELAYWYRTNPDEEELLPW
jgi:hypothetical protein